MNQKKLLVLGMGSPSDKKHFDAVELDGKTIDEFCKEKEIKVYHHPESGDYLTTSIHRTTMDAVGYAQDMRNLVKRGHKVVSVLFGGLALALPGVVAAEACNVPIIGIGSDVDAFFNVYKIPDGTPVGVVEIGNLTKGIDIATRFLNFNDTAAAFVSAGECPNAASAYELVSNVVKGDIDYNNDEPPYFGLTIGIAETPEKLVELDSRVELGIIGVEKKIPSDEVYDALKEINNSVIVGRPKNLGLYAARVIGLNDEDVAAQLIKMREKEAEKYTERMPMALEDFK